MFFHRSLALITLAGLCAGCPSESAEPSAPETEGSATASVGDLLSAPIEDRWIVILQADAPGGDYDAALDVVADLVDELILDLDLVGEGSLDRMYGHVFAGFSMELDEERVAELREHPDVAWVEQDRSMGYEFLGLFEPEAPTTSTQDTPWGVMRVGSAPATAGRAFVLDTGIDLDHPDLSVDTGMSRSFVGGSADDGNGHGTHVAGILGALDNDIGVVGVAAGATLVSVKVLDDDGQGTVSSVLGGIDYVGSRAAAGDVANLSLSGGASDALDEAVRALGASGVQVALAAGNSGESVGGFSPARADGTNLYTVSAIDRGDDFASFSNFGAPVDFAQPGVDIRSTAPGGMYQSLTGTSMAAPHMAGLLLAGSFSPDGTADGDPDGDPDPIAAR